MKKIVLIIFLFMMCISKINAGVDLTPNSVSAILVEASTKKVLYNKDAYSKRSPASMTKIMTLLLTAEALENKKINLNDKVYISSHAASMGGTQIYVEEKSYVTVENLIKGIGIASANDAAVAIAEHIGGTEENFVNMMNERARELGCKNTNFKNPHGLDEEDHYSTAYDIALISSEAVKHDYILKITSTYEDYIDVSNKSHWLVNTNKLVRFYKGIDGLKTGYTSKAMYCLTATANKNDMRLISVVMKVNNKESRSKDTISLLEYGYSMYGTNKIIDKKIYSNKIFIPNSKNREISYYIKDDVKLVVDKNTKDVEYEIETKLNKVKAPLKINDPIGKIIVKYSNEEYEYDLIVKEDVKESNYFQNMINIYKDVFLGKINEIF